ncbi:S1 family peptidase [Streptomyces sp. NPDC126497]|uniref:S1 family peptidase n=1 Tax=Streptomyces sp. NPDC126497 TaxID=3155313 RepID=UPI0033208D29
MDPVKAAELAAELGDDRTAGVYEEKGRPVVAVTDRAAAETVREAGGAARVVPHSAAELESIHAELDRLAGIPNTAWGADPSSNAVVVTLHDGVSDADRARIEEVAERHGDAVRIEELPGRIETAVARRDGNSGEASAAATYYMRGGLGIETYDGEGLTAASLGRICTAAFNVQNSSGSKFLVTAGHCVVGGKYEWQRRAGGVYLGPQVDFEYEPGDWAVIDYQNSEVVPVGSLQLRDESEQSITNSRDVVVGESVKRLGTISQDLVGKVTRKNVTITYDDGVTLYNMIESDLCARLGDSGGPLYSGLSALGILSGATHAEEACGDSDAQADRRTYYEPVHRMLIENGLKIY